MFPIFGQNRTNWLLVLPGWRHWIVVHWCGAFTSLFQTKASICLELWGQGSLPCPLKCYVAMLITTGTNPDRGSATSWSSRKKLSVSSASDYWHPYRSMGCQPGLLKWWEKMSGGAFPAYCKLLTSLHSASCRAAEVCCSWWDQTYRVKLTGELLRTFKRAYISSVFVLREIGESLLGRKSPSH